MREPRQPNAIIAIVDDDPSVRDGLSSLIHAGEDGIASYASAQSQVDLDQEVFTIGFARRITAYKGLDLLDEIGDISPELQPNLLRAVQEQEFERLGSAKPVNVDLRIIAATHRDLAAMNIYKACSSLHEGCPGSGHRSC